MLSRAIERANLASISVGEAHHLIGCEMVEVV